MGFVPPPYPYDRLRALERLADSLPGGVVDCSIGTPCDPVPEVAVRAAAAALANSMGYPASAGSAALRDAAPRGSAAGSASRSTRRTSARASARRSWSRRCRTCLRLRNPQRDTVLYPAVAYPSYEMGAMLAGCRAVPVPLDADWHLDLDAIADADAERALLLWVNEPGNPTSSAAGSEQLAQVAAWARRGIVVASDECYAEYAPDARDDPFEAAPTACSRCTACRSARTSRACGSASTPAIPISCRISSRRASTRA